MKKIFLLVFIILQLLNANSLLKLNNKLHNHTHKSIEGIKHLHEHKHLETPISMYVQINENKTNNFFSSFVFPKKAKFPKTKVIKDIFRPPIV